MTQRYPEQWREGCPLHYHDTASAYQKGCRCDTARDAQRHRDKMRTTGRWPAQFVDATGTARRIRALAAMGWSSTYVGQQLGFSAQAVGCVCGQSRVLRSTADKYKAVYDEHYLRRGPSDAAVREANRRGWAPPLAWDNIDDPAEQPQHTAAASRSPIPRNRLAEDIVEAAFDWRRPRMSHREQRHVVDTAMDERGMVVADVALMLGLTVCAVRQTRTRSNQARAGKQRESKDEMRVAS